MTPRTRLVVLAATAIVVAGVAACGSSAAAPAPSGPARPSAAEVEATKRALDERAPAAPRTVVTWGVDPGAGLVVVGVDGPRSPEVDRFVAGLDPRTLRVDTSAERPRLYPGS